MANSDNTFGVFNKQTNIYSQDLADPVTETWTENGGGSATETVTEQTFSDVDTAKAFFFTTDALTMFDECCTQIQWALVGNNKLKVTFAFGTKGAGTTEANDWAGQFNSRKTALVSANNFHKHRGNSYGISKTDSTEHLF